MRWLVTFVFSLLFFDAFSQGGKPKIEGQQSISTDEDISVTVQMTDLQVRDRDDWFYPFGFTMTLYPGDNYTVSNHTVTPAANFNGVLKVKVTVNDGDNDSNPYDLNITVRPVNDQPVITGQNKLSTNENQALSIKTGDLMISDPDDTKFTLTISNGSNYSVSGTTITPAANFAGTLAVPVTVNDGKVNSASFDLMVEVIAVNDPPKITGQVALATDENKPLAIELAHLTVEDPDNVYPTGFTLHVTASTNSNYSASGNTVTPALNFEGTLSVPVRVNDGKDFSAPYDLKITVKPGNNSPVITGQSLTTINEDQPFTILLSHLTVTDADNTYPNGFNLKIMPGQNFTVVDHTVTPVANFNGKLTVPLVVNDGTSDSAPYNFVITVVAVNDAPVITLLEPEALIFQPGKGPVAISQSLEIFDAENDSIVQAEISFNLQSYRPGFDELKLPIQSQLIKNSFDMGKGTLVLTGKATAAEYTKVLRSVQYDFPAPVESFIEGKKFSIKVSDKIVASAPATREIRTKALDIDLDIPSAFTPNGDMANDTWVIKPLKQSEELDKALLRVYNRHGQVMYETVGFSKPWDGRMNGELLPSDSYFYTIDLGKNYATASIKGIVTILR